MSQALGEVQKRGIKTMHLLVDSHQRVNFEATSNYNYEVEFGANHVFTQGNGMMLRNVIGIDVLQAHFPNTALNITEDNGKFGLKVKDAQGAVHDVSIQCTPGTYDTISTYTTRVVQDMKDSINRYVALHDTDPPNHLVTQTADLNIRVNETAGKRVEMNMGYSGVTFKIVFPERTYTSVLQALGFDRFNPDNVDFSSKKSSNIRPDFGSTKYVDIVLPQLPSEACAHTSDNRLVLSRIPVLNYQGLVHWNNPEHALLNATFSPININRLRVQIYDSNGHFFDNLNHRHMITFRVKCLKNPTENIIMDIEPPISHNNDDETVLARLQHMVEDVGYGKVAGAAAGVALLYSFAKGVRFKKKFSQ